MHRRNRLYKNAIAIILTCTMVLSAGCAGAGKKDDASANSVGEGKTKAVQTTENKDNSTSAQGESSEAGSDNNVADKSDGTKNDEGTQAEAGEADNSNTSDSVEISEADLSSPIEFSYQKNPVQLMAGETEMGSGYYYSITLDKSDKDKFSGLQKSLDEFNSKGEADLNESLNSSIEELKEIFESGWGLAYEYDHDLYPIRSDGRVFSFVVSNYTYLAGAHGYNDYTNYNIDPVTGKEIKFDDVMKVSDDFAQIVKDELIKQNDDLDECMDKESFIEGMPGRLKDDAKGLCWAIGYDGVWLFFEDYAMGSYAAGSRNVKISWFDHPELFTDTYQNYEKDSVPEIADVAKELKDADTATIDAGITINAGDSAEGDGGDEGEGEDWWYHAVVKNPGWSAWVADGIDTDVGTPSVELKEISHKTTDWLDEEAWSGKMGIPLPERLPYNDGTYSFTAVNEADEGTLSLTVMDEANQTLDGNYFFDEFIDAPDQGQGMFADFTEPYILYAALDNGILYVSIGHFTYAAANPHKAYIVAIDTISGETVWKSDDLVCGSNNFLIEGDSIICGYGFTDEPDYIYIINRTNGKTQKQIKVASAPSYFIKQGDQLYVLTYNTEYLYQIK
ncbi:MAG: hypothetical protein K6E70_02170 [Butyrivibrio sp.]|nr:hypothetical protein [Butyrivibrio sp.]